MKRDDGISGFASARPLARGEEGNWERFVETCPEATFFHRIGWKEIIERVFGHRAHYLVAERGGEITGVLPLAEVRSMFFGHSLVSLPFCVYGGVASTDSAAVAALHAAAQELARRLKVNHLELRNRVLREPEWPRQELYVTFRRPIAADLEANMQAIPRKQRAMVRKGIKAGLTSEVARDVNEFYELYADNVHRHGTPGFAKAYFEALASVFGSDCETMIVRDTQGKALSGVLSFYFRDEILPYYAGDRPEARDVAANDFKYWELMRRACERGLRTFDYGRSKRDSGSFAFKKNWGFEPAQLSYEYHLVRADAVPQNNPNNPKYRALISTWRRLPRGVVRAIGPHIVRGLG